VDYRNAFAIVTVPVICVTLVQLYSAYVYKRKKIQNYEIEEEEFRSSGSSDMQMNIVD